MSTNEERQAETLRQHEIHFHQMMAINGDKSSSYWLGSNGHTSLYEPSDTKSSGSNTVICTELHRQGLLSRNDYLQSHADTKRRLTSTHLRGYHAWAIPTVRWMRKSPFATRLFRTLVQARTDEIAARAGVAGKANFLGKLTIVLGEPACLLIGKVVGESNYASLYPADRSLATKE